MSKLCESAQDNNRETQQKEYFGFKNVEHSRDAKWDVYYKMPIDFKTRNILKGGGVSTKRKFKLQTLKEWENTALVVSDYEEKDCVLDSHYIILPPVLLEWRAQQEKKLRYNDRASYYPLSEVDKLQKTLEDNDLFDKFEALFEQFRAQAHLNDPRLPTTLFKTGGKQIVIEGKKTKTRHPECFIKVPTGANKAKFLRETIDSYIQEVSGGK